MYSNKFVLSVICDGQIVKELDNGQVNIPFGSEYTLRLRNRNNRRALAKISIDGENVSGGGIIIAANSFVDIERSVDVARKFKFVALDSAEAQDYGKNGPNPNKTKGTITVDFALEYERPIFWTPSPGVQTHRDYPYIYSTISCSSHDSLTRCASLGRKSTVNPKFFGESLNQPRTDLQEGATVEGGHSSQSFTYTNFTVDDKTWTTLRIFMMGYSPHGEHNQVLMETGEWVSVSSLESQRDELKQKVNKKKIKKAHDQATLEKIKKLQLEIEELQKELEEV